MLANNAMADVNAARGLTPTKQGFRILVVDDNHDSALSLAMMLSIMGHETRTAHDGESAVETAETFLPEVILLDIGLPKLNGYEVAQRIREQAWGASMFLIAVTGWGQDEDRQRSSEVGLNVHMVKPVEPAALERLLAELRRDQPQS
jgi:DNA-binding response OmpR family regulator